MTLTAADRVELTATVSRGRADARRPAHARALLQADAAAGGPARPDEQIAGGLDLSPRTVERVRRRFVEDGLPAALLPKPAERVYARVLGGKREARLIALACSAPPDGKRRWALRLLAERVVEWGYTAAVSHEAVRRALKKTS